FPPSRGRCGSGDERPPRPGGVARMSDEASFLQTIIANPEDDAPRLVFADWLEEQGQAERAEVIRVQCGLAKIADEYDPRRLDLEARARALLRTHRKVLSPLGTQLKKCRFRRGFVEQIEVAPDFFLKRTAKLFGLAPVRELETHVQRHEFE